MSQCITLILKIIVLSVWVMYCRYCVHEYHSFITFTDGTEFCPQDLSSFRNIYLSCLVVFTIQIQSHRLSRFQNLHIWKTQILQKKPDVIFVQIFFLFLSALMFYRYTFILDFYKNVPYVFVCCFFYMFLSR